MISTMYTTLEAWYRTLWAMVHYHKYSYTEINEMMPYERDLFVGMIIQKQEEEKQREN